MAMLNSPQPPIKMHSIYLFFSILTTAPCGFYSVLFAAKLKNRTMEIIIDGYNLIGSNAGLTGNLEHKRNWLVQKLASYHRTKSHHITVVFDGWRSGSVNQVEENRDGIGIVYWRLGEKADSVIVRLARKKGSGCVVVTSDREVRNAVERFGVVALYAGQFSAMMQHQDQSFDDPQAEYHDRQARPRRAIRDDCRKKKESADRSYRS
jgi:predicted RNA-binding protein with PIN domain